MSVLASLKRRVEALPEPLGRPLVYVPFAFRLGPEYARAAKEIERAERASAAQFDALQVTRLRNLLKAAIDGVEFYREFYRSKGFVPSELASVEDWVHVPIVTKADFQGVPLVARTCHGQAGMKINTGGTSGQPLEFYVDRKAFAREWAHMHFIWAAHGYRPHHLKLTFRGKHFEEERALRYNAVHNEYVVNASAPMSTVVDSVLALRRLRPIRWLHGYPSLVAEFAHELGERPQPERSAVRSQLFGVLLGSEFPAPVYRSAIEKVLTSNVVSWYGHSEMAMLARETANGIYESLPTYGHAEAVRSEVGGEHRLVCTSYYNSVHPFIRYDTGDIVEPLGTNCGSLAFRISEGRVGDFVRDRRGRRHSLTAVIFGRHHAAFEVIQHLQVREDGPGNVALLVTPRDSRLDLRVLRAGLELGDLDINWTIEVLSNPIRTPAGKVRLKVN